MYPIHNVLEGDREVSKSYGGVIANRGISISVEDGAIVGLIGPNGSGKTTLFNSIVGAHPIDSGTIRFDGREISKLPIVAIARLGLLRTYQRSRVFREMTCVENMLISISERGRRFFSLFENQRSASPKQVDQLLEFVGLPEKRDLRAGELSFGQQKLLEFAMALMNEPRMLLLDEPTAGINPTLINTLVDRLKQANSELGVTLLIIEHNMRMIMDIAQHIYCLAHGELLAEGEPPQIQNNPLVIEAYLGVH